MIKILQIELYFTQSNAFVANLNKFALYWSLKSLETFSSEPSLGLVLKYLSFALSYSFFIN